MIKKNFCRQSQVKYRINEEDLTNLTENVLLSIFVTGF